jgi:hypothetical protein
LTLPPPSGVTMTTDTVAPGELLKIDAYHLPRLHHERKFDSEDQEEESRKSVKRFCNDVLLYFDGALVY